MRGIYEDESRQNLERLCLATNPHLSFIFKADLKLRLKTDWFLGTAASVLVNPPPMYICKELG